jgi:tetratricopeptide (TPR) repeat protein
MDDLSDIIAAGSAALELLPEDAYVVPAMRTNLGYFQLRRYERTGDSTDLADALELLQKAVETLPEDDARCVTARARLAEALVMRHKETVRQSAAHGFGRAVVSDLQQAIDLLIWCVDQASADDQQRARFLRDLADAYRVGAETDDRPDMLDGAVDALRKVVALGGEDSSKALHELARALGERFMALRHEADLTEAIGLSKKAIASARAGTYEELTAQLGLAEALAMRLILDPSNDEDRRAAMEVYRRVAHTKSAGLAAQVSAAHAWARVAHDGGYLEEALAGYENMLALMAEMAPIGLDDADRLRLLAQEDGRPSRAVACAVAAGQLEHAVELLERGRMMTAPAVSVAADDVEALRQRRPDLAEILGTAQAELTAAAGRNEVLFLPAGITIVSKDRHDQRQRRDAAARNWHDAVAQVRSVPGYQDFLTPARFAVLRNAAQRGPVVVLNASPYRCDALIVRISGVDVVPLPVTNEDVLARVNRYGDAVNELNRAAQTLAGRQAAENELRQVLAWLWDSTAQPVLDALGLLGVVANGPWPRVWWSPGGIFSLFPLHAAGRTPEDGVMDRVQSSYAPSLRLLASLNSTADARASEGPARLLAVGLAQTPRLKNSRLPDVSRELAAVTAACPPERQTVLSDERATRAAVEAALPEHDVLHFACHGRQFPQDPLSSELHLYDRTLSVGDLRWSSLRRARLAVLSACQTAVGGTTLMDEGLHLGAALHMAGCRDVIGTLWTVPDSSTAEIMERVYGHLRRDGELQPGLAADALHLAVRDLRSEAPDLGGAWAPFVHVGGGR